MRDESEIPDRQWVIATVVVAVLLGAACLAQSIELVFGGPAVAGGIYPTIPMLVLALSGLLGRWIRRTERLLVYCTLLVGLPLTASGLMHWFLPDWLRGSMADSRIRIVVTLRSSRKCQGGSHPEGRIRNWRYVHSKAERTSHGSNGCLPFCFGDSSL